MPGDDDFSFTRYVLRLSKKIAQLTKDYVGLPFSTSSQLPFAIDARPKEKAKVFVAGRKWRKGDALVGYDTMNDGRKRMILNLPDGSTMLDMCYPGWEVAVIEESALELFFRRRYLFGDYYGHFLNRTARPLPAKKESATSTTSVYGKMDLDAATARSEEIFRRRRISLQEAMEQQQKRGVPFDTHPEVSESADEDELHGTAAPRSLTQVIIGTKSVRDAVAGTSDDRLVIQKRYSNGETETVERRSKTPITGLVDADLEQMLSSAQYDAFRAVPGATPTEPDATESDSASPSSRL